PTNPQLINKQMTIYVNQYTIEDYPNERLRLGDMARTYTLTHELGHILGFTHPDGNAVRGQGCGLDMKDTTSIMKAGRSDIYIDETSFNVPQEYDRNLLRQLYGVHGVDDIGENYG